ncbi:hypothetical protein KJ359_001737 [Pestalotiopsis sp. 9143b]|nr:hypothetical protein KJ359_001737 [Pestalotiopsis sp. 9143b]
MRLLQLRNGELHLTRDLIRDIPPYAILSHTWGADGDEVTFQDVSQKSGHSKPGYQKILFCGQQAGRDGLDHFWVDTCCIDKTSSAELTKAINSMFQWYRDAAVCYAYLTDVSTSTAEQPVLWQRQFEQSRWFTRGWTLQELLAPVSVRFFSARGDDLGDRKSLQNEIHSITKIPTTALRGTALGQFPTHERLAWAQSRQTTEEEDGAYCLLGIFDVYLPLIYGEGKANAMARLLKEVNQQTGALSNEDFVGRDGILTELIVKILPSIKSNDCQRTVLKGLGGVGKTQIALEAAYRVRERDPNCSVFWVPAITMSTFENAYRGIGEALGTPGIEDDKADVKSMVKTALEKFSSHWLLIIDNVDDIGLLDGEGLRKYIPYNRNGSILFTTRNNEVAVELGASPKNIYAIGEMNKAEALELLQSRLQERQYRDSQATSKLLLHLVYLPLAIKQASAYMAKTRTTTATYLKYCLESDEKQMKLLSTGFEDLGRYSRETNPIATTWLISFQHLERTYPLATTKERETKRSAEHPSTLSSMNNLALALRSQGKYEEAEEMHRETLERKKSVLGPEHPDTLTSMNNLAHVLHSQGKYEEAEEIYQATMKLRTEVLGPSHPSTLRTSRNLEELLAAKAQNTLVQDSDDSEDDGGIAI